MAGTLFNKLNGVLTDLNSTVEGIKAVAISSRDGFEIADIVNTSDVDMELMHAMSASIVDLSSQAACKLGMTTLQKIVIYTAEGVAIAFNIEDSMVLLCLLNLNSDVGIAVQELEKSANSIKKVVQF